MKRSLTLIIKLTSKLAFNFKADNTHWNSTFGHPLHGPQVWPWWLLFSLSIVKLFKHQPPGETLGSGSRLWIYTRWGALYFDFVFDRRGVVKKRVQCWVNSWS